MRGGVRGGAVPGGAASGSIRCSAHPPTVDPRDRVVYWTKGHGSGAL